MARANLHLTKIYCFLGDQARLTDYDKKHVNSPCRACVNAYALALHIGHASYAAAYSGPACLQLKLTASGVAHNDFRLRMRALLEEVKAQGGPQPLRSEHCGPAAQAHRPQDG